MFGVPSLTAAAQAAAPSDATRPYDYDSDEESNARPPRTLDPDSMDWEPIQAAVAPQRRAHDEDDRVHLRQQRFFAPEQPTGLENLLMRTRLVDSDDDARKHNSGHTRHRNPSQANETSRWNWCWVYTISTVPVVVVIFALWASYGVPYFRE